MTDVGYAALLISFLVALYSVVAFIIGARKRMPELVASARNGLIAVCALNAVAAATLVYSFLTDDFRVNYVAEYSARGMGLPYKIAAFWAGQGGSLLLWATVLGMFGAVAMIQNRKRHPELIPYVGAIISAVSAFFLGLMAFMPTANPFTVSAIAPADGQGLNPLLQNPGMFFHPPSLYLGYVGVTVPFAFAMAALITGRLGDDWIRSTRRWTLIAWAFLTLGNLLGAQWAYVELGWGGFWGWDPVENASFLPWLTMTAYLHSVMIQQRRGMLKVWNMVLIMSSFLLSIFGTFLTRSGVLSSVHAFGDSSLGVFFLVFIGVALVGSVVLLIDRLPLLKGENELDGVLSRESSFLLNNLILVGAAFATFWGTVFPLVSEALRGVKVTVGAPFFNQVNGPIFLVLVALMGVCPLIGWRRATPENLIRNFAYPAVATVVLAVVLFALGVQDFGLVPYALCGFVAATILMEWIRGTRARSSSKGVNYLSAAGGLVWANKPRYGGYFVHLGIVLIAMAVVGTMSYKSEVDATLAKGQSMQVGSYTLMYNGLSTYQTETRTTTSASMTVVQNGKVLGRLLSEKYQTAGSENPVTEVGIRTTMGEDLYLILASWTDDGSASFRAIINPLVIWMWIGGAVVIFGTIIALWPDARERKRVALRTKVEAINAATVDALS